MLTVLSGAAEFERSLILQRTQEGRARALGKRLARQPKLTRRQSCEALKRVAVGEPMREIALAYAVNHSTISRLKARQLPRWCDRPGALRILGWKHRRMGAFDLFRIIS